MPVFLTIYGYAINAAKPLLEWILTNRLRRGKEDPARLNERMGIAGESRPEGPLVWVHAASVGEAQSSLILIDALAEKNLSVLVTTGTVTSAHLMEQRLPSYAFHQYMPLDHKQWVKQFLNHWKPDFVLWMESELWPNMLLSIKDRKIPAVLVNARLSEKSFRWWNTIPASGKYLLSSFARIFAQSEKDAGRFHAIGAKNVLVTENLKYSATPLPYDDTALTTLKTALGTRKLWVYASTHQGEEELACNTHKKLKEQWPDILTIIVPRHPDRREEIAAVCFENGLKYTLRSQNTALPAADDDIYIADTLGELGLFYNLTDIAMIGRSFSSDGGGGHNPIEAAQLGCAVLTGPNNQYQRQVYDDMRMAGAVIEIMTEDILHETIHDLLSTPEKMQRQQEKSARFVEQKLHVVQTIMKEIEPILDQIGRNHAA